MIVIAKNENKTEKTHLKSERIFIASERSEDRIIKNIENEQASPRLIEIIESIPVIGWILSRLFVIVALLSKRTSFELIVELNIDFSVVEFTTMFTIILVLAEERDTK